MERVYQITGLLLLVFAVLVGIGSVNLRYYSSLGPGPGFFPLWLSILLGILSVAMICQATFGKAQARPGNLIASRAGYLRVLAVLGALVGLVVLIEPLGFRLTMFAFYLVLLLSLGRQRLIVSCAIALAGSFGCYYAFTAWLKVALPVGHLGI